MLYDYHQSVYELSLSVSVFECLLLEEKSLDLCQIWHWGRLSHRFNSFSLTIHPRALNLSSLIKEEIEQAHGRVLGKNVAKPT